MANKISKDVNLARGGEVPNQTELNNLDKDHKNELIVEDIPIPPKPEPKHRDLN